MAIQNALVVDDSKLARITLKRLLEQHDLKVELASSAEEALEMIGQAPPDVIFMDHMMPSMDGFQATQKIKADPATSHIPVIMCTGKEGIENYDEEARAIGASGTLTKPPQVDVLSGLLERLRQTPEPAAAEPVNEGDKVPQTCAATAEPAAPAAEPAGEPTPGVAPTQQSEQVATLSQQVSRLEQQISALDARMAAVLAEIEPIKKQPAPEPVDEESLAARATRDAERTLMPLVHSELNALSSQVQARLDDAISESRADLEEQIETLQSELKRQATVSADPPPSPVDEEALTHRVLTVAQDTVEAMLAHKLAQVEQTTQERIEQALASAESARNESPDPAASAFDPDALEQRVRQWVREQIEQESAVLADQFAARMTQAMDQRPTPHPAEETDPADNEWIRELMADNQRLNQALSTTRVQAWTLGLIALVVSGVSLAKVLGLLP